MLSRYPVRQLPRYTIRHWVLLLTLWLHSDILAQLIKLSAAPLVLSLALGCVSPARSASNFRPLKRHTLYNKFSSWKPSPLQSKLCYTSFATRPHDTYTHSPNSTALPRQDTPLHKYEGGTPAAVATQVRCPWISSSILWSTRGHWRVVALAVPLVSLSRCLNRIRCSVLTCWLMLVLRWFCPHPLRRLVRIFHSTYMPACIFNP